MKCFFIQFDFASGCSNNFQCKDHKACLNGNCINPCKLKSYCEDLANCHVVNHIAVCKCPKGYKGSPSGGCDPGKYTRPKPIAMSFITSTKNNLFCIIVSCVTRKVLQHISRPVVQVPSLKGLGAKSLWFGRR